MKSGTLVMFEGQIGTVVFRKSSHYADVAVDFVPVDEGKVNMERAADYFPVREAYFMLSVRERDLQTEQTAIRERLNTLYDAFVAKWGFSMRTTTRSLSCLTASVSRCSLSKCSLAAI